MSLYCPAWDNNITILDGDTVENAYNRNQCRFFIDCTAYIDSDGEDFDHDTSGDYNCSEHETNPRMSDDIYETAYERILQNNIWHACPHEDHDDASEVPLFNTLEAMNEHVVDTHQQNEDDEATETTWTPELNPTFAARDMQTHELPLQPHPPLTPELRASVLAFLATQGDYISGILVNTNHFGDHLPTDIGPTDRYLDTWHRTWPNHFWISRQDPHLTRSENTRSTHSAWAQ